LVWILILRHFLFLGKKLLAGEKLRGTTSFYSWRVSNILYASGVSSSLAAKRFAGMTHRALSGVVWPVPIYRIT
jgi:hypothetical protein